MALDKTSFSNINTFKNKELSPEDFAADRRNSSTSITEIRAVATVIVLLTSYWSACCK